MERLRALDAEGRRITGLAAEGNWKKEDPDASGSLYTLATYFLQSQARLDLSAESAEDIRWLLGAINDWEVQLDWDPETK